LFEQVAKVDYVIVLQWLARLFSAGLIRLLKNIDKTLQHEVRVTPSELVDEWLPWVHIAIGNLKEFLLGTFHGVSGKYLQEYLSEFCYRFNRRQMEKEIPNRLLKIAIIHTPVHSH
jgi:hypothetical protein